MGRPKKTDTFAAERGRAAAQAIEKALSRTFFAGRTYDAFLERIAAELEPVPEQVPPVLAHLITSGDRLIELLLQGESAEEAELAEAYQLAAAIDRATVLSNLALILMGRRRTRAPEWIAEQPSPA